MGGGQRSQGQGDPVQTGRLIASYCVLLRLIASYCVLLRLIAPYCAWWRLHRLVAVAAPCCALPGADRRIGTGMAAAAPGMAIPSMSYLMDIIPPTQPPTRRGGWRRPGEGGGDPLSATPSPARPCTGAGVPPPCSALLGSTAPCCDTAAPPRSGVGAAALEATGRP